MNRNNILNFVYAFGSNVITLLVSMVVTLVLPKAISVREYSLVQLYVFYSTYIGIAAFGWPEGILVNYAGKDYSEIDKESLRKQIKICAILECFLTGILGGLSVCFINDTEKKLVMILCSVSLIPIIPRLMMLDILQATSRFKDFATCIVIEKSVYLFGSIFLLVIGVQRFYWYILSIVLGYICSSIYCVVSLKDLNLIRFRNEKIFEKAVLLESAENINIGVKILFATLAGNLIVGIVRIGIEKQWSVEVFGKVSLTISVANLLMVFINAVATIMLPTLRRSETEQLGTVYTVSRCCIMVVLLGALVFYLPMNTLLSIWLPEYSESLRYMAILFPMCVFSSKTSMIIEPYLKALHKEKWLLMINIVTVSLSVITTLITTYWLHNLDLAVASIVFLLAFRCVFAELLLSTVLDVNVKMDIALELALTVIFIVASWFVGGIAGLSIYAVAYLIYLFIKRKDVAFVANMALRVLRRA